MDKFLALIFYNLESITPKNMWIILQNLPFQPVYEPANQDREPRIVVELSRYTGIMLFT